MFALMCTKLGSPDEAAQNYFYKVNCQIVTFARLETAEAEADRLNNQKANYKFWYEAVPVTEAQLQKAA